MNAAERAIFNSHQRVLHAGMAAREWFKKRNPILFAKIQIAIDDEREALVEKVDPSEYGIEIFDSCAKAYLEFVELGAMDSHDHYMAILHENRLRTVKASFGVPVGMPAVFEGSDIDQKVMARLRHWRKEAYKRLVPDDSPETPGITSRPGYRSEMDEWMERSGIANLEDAARKLAIGVDTLKSIRSDKGTARYGDDTLEDFLAKTGIAKK